jgi:Dolichol-phosphate mannosyltransferase subunit 3 (DPM3)
MGLLRYQLFLTYGAAFLSVWYYSCQPRNLALLQQEPWNFIPPTFISYAPIWSILTLGVVLLSRLLLGVMAYQDCPEAAREIEMQIKEAKQELKKRKIID